MVFHCLSMLENHERWWTHRKRQKAPECCLWFWSAYSCLDGQMTDGSDWLVGLRLRSIPWEAFCNSWGTQASWSAMVLGRCEQSRSMISSGVTGRPFNLDWLLHPGDKHIQTMIFVANLTSNVAIHFGPLFADASLRAVETFDWFAGNLMQYMQFLVSSCSAIWTDVRKSTAIIWKQKVWYS